MYTKEAFQTGCAGGTRQAVSVGIQSGHTYAQVKSNYR